MNVIDAFIAGDNILQNKYYKDCQVPIKEFKKIPFEEILKSDTNVSQMKRKQKKDTYHEHSTNKENEKPGLFSGDHAQTKSTKVSNDEIKQKKREHRNILGSKNEKEIKLSSENQEKYKTRVPPQRAFNASSTITTVRRSSRLQQKNQNLTFCATSNRYGRYVEYDCEIENKNNTIAGNAKVQKRGKSSSQNANFKDNTLKQKITKNTFSKITDCINSSRNLSIVCERIDEIEAAVKLLPEREYKEEKVKKSHKSNISNTSEGKMITSRTLRSNTSKANIAATCLQNDDKLTQEQEKISITKSIPNKINNYDNFFLEGKDFDNKKELIKKLNGTNTKKRKNFPVEKRSCEKDGKIVTKRTRRNKCLKKLMILHVYRKMIN
ncbi:hypothetical protein Avbf_04484 [Armadillidium vulgare]|nr:hypothetical protein Avbf_04484 [Armadillidium vulgare]